MNLNWLTKFCLITAGLLLGGVLLVQAAGFVSYEDDNKIIVWDPVKMVNKGLKMSAAGINDLEDVPDGVIKIENKDLYVRSFMGFECPDYPNQTNCTTIIGDIGGDTFLKIESLKGDDLLLKSAAGIRLNENSDGLRIEGNIFLTGGKNLILTDLPAVARPEATKAVFVNNLDTEQILGLDSLTIIPGISFSGSGVFEPRRKIKLSYYPVFQ